MLKDGKLKIQRSSPKNPEQELVLPDGWRWVNLTDLVAIVTDGDHQPPPKATEGIPFLVISNVKTGRVTFDGCRFVPESYFESLDWTRKPTVGDILYTVTGSYGTPISVTDEKQFCVQRHIAILKTVESTPSEYLRLFLSSKYAYEYATRIATGIAQKTVPLTGLRKMPIPLPPLAEQKAIVSKVTELLTLCDHLETLLNQQHQITTEFSQAAAQTATA